MKSHSPQSLNEYLDRVAEAHARSSLNAAFRTNCLGFFHGVLQIMFPHFATKRLRTRKEVTAALSSLRKQLARLLNSCRVPLREAQQITDRFFATLPELESLLIDDAAAILTGDPAARDLDEVILCYPGFFATATYRIAHTLHRSRVRLIPRILTEYAHQMTGIDIHPGASIGRSFFIDHGTGIVIGETSTIHNHVKLYQGVTLGALTVTKDQAELKRHPTIEDRVVVYANATILGGSTTIGHDSIIGGNVWLTKSVDPFSAVYQEQSAQIERRRPKVQR